MWGLFDHMFFEFQQVSILGRDQTLLPLALLKGPVLLRYFLVWLTEVVGQPHCSLRMRGLGEGSSRYGAHLLLHTPLRRLV